MDGDARDLNTGVFQTPCSGPVKGRLAVQMVDRQPRKRGEVKVQLLLPNPQSLNS
jgi:hypothetical protein